MYLILRTIAFLFGILIATNANAQPSPCADVLVNKVYDVTDYRHSSFYFMDRASSQSEKLDFAHSAGAGFDIDGVPIKANDAGSASRQLGRSDRSTFISDEREQFLLYSGASNILKAWSDCISSKGDIRLRFEPDHQQEGLTNKIIMHIYYYPLFQEQRLLDQPEYKLLRRPSIAAKSIEDSNDCLDPKHIYRAGKDSCDVIIETNSVWDTGPVTLPFIDAKTQAKHSITGFFPMRARVKVETKIWPAGNSPEYHLHASAQYSASESSARNVQVVHADPNFVFLSSIDVRKGGNTSNCKMEARSDGETANLYTAVTRSDGEDEYCDGYFSGKQARFYWDPPPPPAQTNTDSSPKATPKTRRGK
ncbi:hypothetical protein [Bradyrhizobium sp. NAS80.1]|uniref:hypothetical protein n=1 Tax=Bradyrhizobium sp. NAS80.1 TaxID=1680159 RepID=UPI0011615177|nr:hypothetical protein [Bradyrhizobium sp. NAS80.1]